MGKSQAKCIAVGAALTAMLSSASSAEPMRCEITSKYSCAPAGCAANKLGVFNLIDLDLGTLSRLRRPRNLSKSWSRLAATKGLPKVTFHALRHTHVSMLLRAGVDVLTVSRRIGHSNASITLDVYGHLMKGADAAAANAIEGLLR